MQEKQKMASVKQATRDEVIPRMAARYAGAGDVVVHGCNEGVEVTFRDATTLPDGREADAGATVLFAVTAESDAKVSVEAFVVPPLLQKAYLSTRGMLEGDGWRVERLGSHLIECTRGEETRRVAVVACTSDDDEILLPDVAA